MIKPLIAALMLLATPAVAQDTKCLPTGQAESYFESLGAVKVFSGEFPQGTMEIWAERDTDGPSWVAVVALPSGQTCLLTEGLAFDVQELPPNV
jgi:hypothetical protein